jgi:hypothetical protein
MNCGGHAPVGWAGMSALYLVLAYVISWSIWPGADQT